MATKYYCDACGAEGDVVFIVAQILGRGIGSAPTHAHSADLCNACREAKVAKIAAFLDDTFQKKKL
jgi:hypothetical protein